METMKAVVINADNEKKYMDVPIPEAGDDEILIEVKAAGICGGDVSLYYGREACGAYPLIMGHEFSGAIVHKGKNVSGDWKVGDRVVSENTADVCGYCPSCASGHFVNCQHRVTMGYHTDGCFTKYVKLGAHVLQTYPNCLFHIPDSISFEEATVLEPASNAYKALIQEGGLRAGENVVIFGAGPMGLMPIAHAKIAGADKIILVGLQADKGVRFDVAKKFGATHLLTSDTQDIAEEVKRICGEDGVRLVLDAAGAPETTHMAIEMVHNEGTVVRIAMSGRPYNFSLNDLVNKSITLRGHMGYDTQSWKRSIALAASGKLSLKTIITQTMPMSEFDKGFAMMRDQKASKIVLIPD